jgi:hypothetical protein
MEHGIVRVEPGPLAMTPATESPVDIDAGLVLHEGRPIFIYEAAL